MEPVLLIHAGLQPVVFHHSPSEILLPNRRDPESDQRAVRGINAGKPERNGNLPVHGVQRVRLVVVSPLVMSHVNRDRRVEGGEEMVGGCRSREQSRMSEGGRGDFKKGETFQRSTAKR